MYAPKGGMVVYSNSEGSRFGGSSAISIEEGAQVRERQSIIKLPDLANMQVDVKVHESKIENLERGMRALIRVQGRELQGTVISVANQPEATSRWEGNVKEYKTIVKIDGEPEGLRPGMTAEVEILVTNLKDVVRVPTSAVVETGIEHHCWSRTARPNAVNSKSV
jgi:multidrug efflux pump subunit AcrA (membrane-fusion protein)